MLHNSEENVQDVTWHFFEKTDLEGRTGHAMCPSQTAAILLSGALFFSTVDRYTQISYCSHLLLVILHVSRA